MVRTLILNFDVRWWRLLGLFGPCAIEFAILLARYLGPINDVVAGLAVLGDEITVRGNQAYLAYQFVPKVHL